MARRRQRHGSGWLALLLVPIAVPLVLLVKLGERFGLKTSEDLNAAQVEACLRDFLEGRGGEWDWDDFTSIPIADPALERIRAAAAAVDLPLGEGGRSRLIELIECVRDLEP